MDRPPGTPARPRRVVLFPSAYLPALGGVEELTRHLALALAASGALVEVWVGTPGEGDPPSVEELDGITVRRFPLPLPRAEPVALAAAPVRIARALRRLSVAVGIFRPDVLHVQCFGPNGPYAAALARRHRIPLVVSLQGETVMDDADIFGHSVVLRWSLRRALSSASAVTGCSEFTLRDARDRFGLRGGVVVPNGVDLVEPADGVGWSWPRPYLFALGRLVPNKGFDLLLDAFASLTPAERTHDLLIAGAGAGERALGERIAASGLEGTAILVGRLSREDVRAAMDGAAAVVVPSRLEPFGIVAIEAWRSGAPLVVTDRGGPAEYVRDGEDGLLVDPTDRPALAAALERVMGDPALRSRLSAAGRLRAAEFGWPAIARRYLACYPPMHTEHDGGGEAHHVA